MKNLFEDVVSLIGNTPIVRLNASARHGSHALREARVHEPWKLGEGPDRRADDRRRRGSRASETGRHHRRVHFGKHRHGARDGRNREGIPHHPGHAGQGQQRENQGAARLRGPRDHHADRGLPGRPALLLLGSPTHRRGDPQLLLRQPVSESVKSPSRTRRPRARRSGARWAKRSTPW